LQFAATDDLGNASDYVTCGPLSIGFAPIPPVAFAPSPVQSLPSPAHLRLTTARITHGQLLVRGRLAGRATGSVMCSYTARGRHPVHGRATVRSGAYKLLLRVPFSKGILSIRYSGDRAFAPQRITRRVG